MLFNVWNFLEFNILFTELLLKRGAYFTTPACEQLSVEGESAIGKLEKFCARTPLLYFPTLKRILVEKQLGFLLERRKFRFLDEEELFSRDLVEKCKLYFKVKARERKKAEESARLSKLNHAAKKSKCCAPASETYETLNRLMHLKGKTPLQIEALLI